MSYYEDEFYHESRELDLQVEEFKKSLMESVKEEFIAELERLKNENNQLTEVKNNFALIKQEYKNKERQLEVERRELKRKVRNERLSELTKDFQIIMYRANSERVKQPKCSNCDNNRRLYYKTPLGNDAWEYCTCNDSYIVYVPRDYMRVEFSISDGMKAWYQINNFGERDEYAKYDVNSIHHNSVYSEGMDYDEVNKYHTFFKNQEDCQKYCDWLNENRV